MVKDCDNVAEKYGICRSHYKQVSPHEASMQRMIEQMTVMHRLRGKHTRQVQRLARQAGLVLVKKPSYYESLVRADG
jgi:hypothetical protein